MIPDEQHTPPRVDIICAADLDAELGRFRSGREHFRAFLELNPIGETPKGNAFQLLAQPEMERIRAEHPMRLDDEKMPALLRQLRDAANRICREIEAGFHDDLLFQQLSLLEDDHA